MISRPNADVADVRVWVVAAEAWQPESLFDVPPRSTALFPATERCLTGAEAEQFVAGFNEQMFPLGGRRWSVARRVTHGFDGDLMAGQRIEPPDAQAGDRSDVLSGTRPPPGIVAGRLGLRKL